MLECGLHARAAATAGPPETLSNAPATAPPSHGPFDY